MKNGMYGNVLQQTQRLERKVPLSEPVWSNFSLVRKKMPLGAEKGIESKPLIMIGEKANVKLFSLTFCGSILKVGQENS